MSWGSATMLAGLVLLGIGGALITVAALLQWIGRDR